ncbi:putative sugar O-methyltransferase [Candidatus Pseudothioglobus singularis]|jgi:hypothetical protein|nr:putative sugar O-methyltransferase [Candidatus Pseudothioglobus singularis]
MKNFKLKIVLRSFVDFLLNFTSFSLIKDYYYDSRSNDSIVISREKNSVDDKIIKEIFKLFSETGPLYENLKLAPELEIGGAWAGNIALRKKQQLDCIKNNDQKAYTKLVNSMFQNELVDSMWDVLYFSKINKFFPRLPKKFIQLSDAFKYISDKKLQDLAYSSGGGEWGMPLGNKIIKPTDPGDGIKANNLLLLAETFNDKDSLTICDLGSGFGGVIEKLARWHQGVARYVLIDIPLNLTTAYAYLSFGFDNDNLHLIKSPDQFYDLINKNMDSNQFILLPSAYVDCLKEMEINILHNHGSLSEMDEETIKYYLDTLVTKNLDYFIEINSAKPEEIGVKHREISSKKYPGINTHKILSRSPTWLTSCGHRYLTTTYIKK